MIEESWDDYETPRQQSTTHQLGIGRGRLAFSSNKNNGSTLVSRWNGSAGAPAGFNTFRSNTDNNDENSKPNNSGIGGFRNTGNNFGSRPAQSGFSNAGSGVFRSFNDGNSRACFNCNQTGHMSRECSEPQKETRNSRPAFGTGMSDRNSSFRPSTNQSSSAEAKPMFTGWRGNGTNTVSKDSTDVSKRSTFGNPTIGGSFNKGGGAASGNCYNCNQPGHLSRDCPEMKKLRDNGGNGFFGGGRRNDKVSGDIFDQPGARVTDRYIPPPPPTSESDIFGEAVTKGENFDKYHRTQVRCTPEGKVKPIELYEEGNLTTQVLYNIRRAHFEEPTPIQRYAIPCIGQRDDLMACAQTGSGKTAAFLLPIISNLLKMYAHELPEKHHPPSPLCLVVSPTRELALQTEREARKFAYQTPVIPCSAVGGHDMFTTTDRLRDGCHILSATTGRLKDMVEKGRISLKQVKYFILDEADRMLDTGFEPDIRKLEALGLPPKEERITSMFSATFPDEVQRLAKHFLRDNYIFLAVGILGGANEDISQTIELIPQRDKKDRLFQLLEAKLKSERCLIFVETKRSADYIGALLSQRDLMSTTMHADRTQRQRLEAVQQFTDGKCPILVATSVAARGLDFPLIGYVINYDLPDTADFYIHRIGRTGRAGHLGKSISFFDPDRESDRNIAPELVQKLSEAGQEVPDFLKQCAETPIGTNRFGGKDSDMRSGRATYSQTTGPSGGTASAGAAEDWD